MSMPSRSRLFDRSDGAIAISRRRRRRGLPAGFRLRRLSEAEAVLVYKNGTYALIEIKLGDDEAIDEAAKNLLKLQEDLIQKPLYLMVITKSRYAYKRDDGVYVVPLATLRN